MNYVPPKLAPKIYLPLLYPNDGEIEKESAQYQKAPASIIRRTGPVLSEKLSGDSFFIRNA